MKRKELLVLIACLTAMPVQADMLDLMQGLPKEIVVDEKDSTFNFQKSMRSDSFFITENAQSGNTYRQAYHNEICFASVTHMPADVGRMSNAKTKRYIKDITHFQITRQDSFKIADTQFFMNVEAIPEQTTVLLLGGQKESFLKIDVTCQTMPQLVKRGNEKTAIYFAKKIAETVVPLVKEVKPSSETK